MVSHQSKPRGVMISRLIACRVTHVHLYETERVGAGVLREQTCFVGKRASETCCCLLSDKLCLVCRLARYAPHHYSPGHQYLSGTLYVRLSQVVEVSPLVHTEQRQDCEPEETLNRQHGGPCINLARQPASTGLQDAHRLRLHRSAILAAYLMYSELNFL